MPEAVIAETSRATGAVHIERASKDDAGAWNAWVERHPYATAYHRWAWRELVESVFGHECQYWIARDDSRAVLGVLPLVRLRSRLFGDYAVSLPFANYGGALAVSEAVREALMEVASEEAQRIGLSHVEFRDRTPASENWIARTHKALMWRELPRDTDTLWRDIGGKMRNSVRRPEREKVTVSVGREELLYAFYRVFARNMRDLGTPVYTRRLFREVLARFPDAFIVAVFHEGVPAAAGLLLPSGDRLEIPWASSIRDYNRLEINKLLYWRCLAAAVERGYRVFDFGRSTVDSGTWRFKRSWGAESVACHWHYWVAEGGSLPELSPDNPKYRFAIGAWKRLPVRLANVLGPSIVRNLP